MRRYAPAIVLLFLSFALRTAGLQTQSYWYDEGYSVMFARNDPAAIVTQAARLELNTPLHYLALKLWMGLAGDNEFSSRLFSVACGILVVALAGLLATAVPKPARSDALLWAMALTGLWPVNVATSQETRMYALAVLLSLASVAVLVVRCLPRGRRRDWMVWGVLCLAAFGTHVLAAFVVFAQGIVIAAWWLTQRGRRPAAPIVALAAVALSAGAWAAWLWSWRGDYGTTYTAPLNIADTFIRSLAALALPRLQPEELIVPAAVLVAVLMLGVLLSGARTARLLAIVCGLSVAGIALFCVLTGKFAGRYPAIAAPVLTVALGVAIGAFRPVSRRARALAGSVVCALCVAGVLAWRIDPMYANEDFRGAAAYLRQHASPEEPIVLVSGHLAPVFAYYYGADGWVPVPDDDVLDVRHVLDYDLAVPPLNAALAGKDGAWLLEWQAGVIDPTHLAPELMRRQARGRWHEPDPPDLHGLTLRHYRYDQPYQPYQPLPDQLPALQSRIERLPDQERGLDALGCHQFVKPRSGDATMEVVCFWRFALVSGLATDTRVSLRLVDDAGAWRTQADVYLAAPYALPGTLIEKSLAAFYQLELPPELPPGTYMLHAVPYFRESLDPSKTKEISPRIYTPVEVLPAR